MDRAEWLKQMRGEAETLYDRLSPRYWVTFGFYENQAHLGYLQKFIDLVKQRPGQPGIVLSAACGAGRYDGLLLEAGFSVLGIDQSAGMLARAREHFPAERFPMLTYQKLALQDMDFREAFDGITCIDALEHVNSEDYPGILCRFQQALKPGGLLYFTVETIAPEEREAAYRRALARGLPVVPGELVDQADIADVQSPGDLADAAVTDKAVYHYYPPLEQVRDWLGQAGLSIEAEGAGSGYHHFIASKRDPWFSLLDIPYKRATIKQRNNTTIEQYNKTGGIIGRNLRADSP